MMTETGPRDVLWEGNAWLGIRTMFEPDPRSTGERFSWRTPLLSPVEPRVLLGISDAVGPRGTRAGVRAFLKSVRTVVGPDAVIPLDGPIGTVVGEAEVALVMRSYVHRVSVDNARHALLGWTLANDVTAVDRLEGDPTMFSAKGRPGFTPLGPWIETEIMDVELRLTDGADRYSAGSTALLQRNAYELVAEISQLTPLGPGDVILSGAPNTALPLSGDTTIVVSGTSAIGTMTLVSRTSTGNHFDQIGIVAQ